MKYSATMTTMKTRRSHLRNRHLWAGIGLGNARRINLDGSYDFFWVVMEDGALGLMLKLSTLPTPLPKIPKLRNLDISFRSLAKGAAFVITLKERSQIELFEVLCLDVVRAAESAESAVTALQLAIKRTYRWHYLLKSG